MDIRPQIAIVLATSRRLWPVAATARLLRRSLPLLFVGLVLPNALALAAGTVADLPPRTSAVALYAAIALFGGRLPGAVLVLLGLLAVMLDLLLVVSRLFFLEPDAIPSLIGLDVVTTLLGTPVYAAAALAAATFTAVYLAFLLRAGSAMRRGSRLVFAAGAAALLLGDALLDTSAAYDLGPLASFGRPFESASVLSGFDLLPDQPQPPRTLLVVVESLGILRDAGQRAILTAPFDDPALRRLYAVTTGTTAFFGATVFGEMRELCGAYRAPRQAFAEDGPDCLPARFAARGFRTVSLHGYLAAFYGRAHWYPLAGFQKSLFAETLGPRLAPRCAGPFPGPCDTDVAAEVEAELAAPGRSFVYWLTLNSHVPVPRGAATPRQRCGEPDSPFADPEVCAMVEVWQDVFAAVARLALAHPGTEILLVGDHAPPLWRRAARRAFEPDRVPWIRLAPVAVPVAALP